MPSPLDHTQTILIIFLLSLRADFGLSSDLAHTRRDSWESHVIFMWEEFWRRRVEPWTQYNDEEREIFLLSHWKLFFTARQPWAILMCTSRCAALFLLSSANSISSLIGRGKIIFAFFQLINVRYLRFLFYYSSSMWKEMGKVLHTAQSNLLRCDAYCVKFSSSSNFEHRRCALNLESTRACSFYESSNRSRR